jgi:tryptophan 2,3-dioxygenase
MNPKKPLYYSEYLSLDQILNAQHPESAKHGAPAHDEMLFIIMHQTFELWFKLFLFELDSVIDIFRKDFLHDEDMHLVEGRLERIVEIQKLMVDQFDVLETMSPSDFLNFRDFLIPASGFQSAQYKLIEKKIGITLPDAHNNYSMSVMDTKDKQDLKQPIITLLESMSRWQERNPFLEMDGYSFEKEYEKAIREYTDYEVEKIRNHPLMSQEKIREEIKRMETFRKNLECIFDDEAYDQEIAEGKKKISRKAFLSILFVRLYSQYAILQMPHRILDLIIEINEQHVLWKQRHLLIIQRMIGMKMGTGGTSGRAFLEKTIGQSYIFSDLIEMPSYMLSRQYIPEIPEDIRRKMGNFFTSAIGKS